MSNTERFTGRVESYERNRQRYDAEAILPLLRVWCGLQAEWIVADIGAGTGMLAEVFLQNGNSVLAIEPNAEMRTACERLTQRWPTLTVRNGTAETTGLSDHSVQMVAAGRAFHWFDIPRALTEFRRILKPGGWLVLVSLGRAHDDTEQSIAFEDLLLRYGTDYAYIRAGYRVHENLHEIFTEAMHQSQIAGEQALGWEAFLDQTMSLSVTPARNDERFPAFESALHTYFERFATAGILRTATTCWVTAGGLSRVSNAPSEKSHSEHHARHRLGLFCAP